MICVDNLVGDIPKNCSQKRLRGYTGNIKLYDYRGYVLNQNQYNQSVTLEADPYSILPLGQPSVREDNTTVYTHTCEFVLQNEDPEVIKTLSDFTQIPVVLRCELESGEWVECFSRTGGKLLLKNDLGQGQKANKNEISFQHFDKTALEPYPPMEKSIVVTYTEPIVSLGISPSETAEKGKVTTLTLTPGFIQNDAGVVNQVVFKENGVVIQTQTDLTPYVHSAEAIEGSIPISVEVSYDEGPIKEDELGNPAAGHIEAGTKSASKNFIGALRKWYGPYGTTPPLTGSDIRTLEYTYDESFTLNTGTTSLFQVIAVPTTREVVSVIDLDSAGLEITSSYLLSGSILSVPDGGGSDEDYNVYISQSVLPYSSSHRHVVTLKTVTPPIDTSIINIEDFFDGNAKWSPDIRNTGEGILPSNILVETLDLEFTESSNPQKITLQFDYFIPSMNQNRIIGVWVYSDVGPLFLFNPAYLQNTIGLSVETTAYTQTDSTENVWRSAFIEIDTVLKTLKVYIDNIKIFDVPISQSLIDSHYGNLTKIYLKDTNASSGNMKIDNLILKSDT